MRNKRRLIITLLQIVLVVIFISGYKSYVDFSLKPIKVFGYSADLEAGAKITNKDLVMMEVSQSTLTKNMITVDEANQIVGMYTKMDVVGGSIAYAGQLTDVNSADKFASLDLSNARVITIETDYLRSGMGGFDKGDTVDLLYKATATDLTNGNEFTYSKVFMSNVTVYSVNTSSGYKYVPHGDMLSTATEKNQNGDEQQVSYDAIGSVSLIVTPEQAEEIRVREATGQIEFLMRFDESETHDTLGFVIGTYSKIFSGFADAETGSLSVSTSTVVNRENVSNENAETDKGNNSGTFTPSAGSVE